MFSYKNFTQLADTLQTLDGLDLSSKDKYFFLCNDRFDEAKKALLLMKDVKQTLDSLCADVTAEVAALTALIMPTSLHHGLESIPDEVFGRILALDTYDAEYGDRPEELRLVNRRFRDVVSSTPECWSRITPETPRRNIFLDHPVDLENARWEDIEDGYYQGRIRHLDIDTHGIKDKDLENLDLSSVKSLTIRGSENPQLPLTHFPQLTSLSCSYIPQPSGLQLTHCKLDIPIEYLPKGDDEDDHYIPIVDFYRPPAYTLRCGLNYTKLIHFLASMPSLQSLSFPYDASPSSILYFYDPSYQYIPDNTIVALPKLKYLHIRCSCLCDTLLKVLKCPKLETMDVLLDRFHNDQRYRGIDFETSLKFPNVTSLTIRGEKHRRVNHNSLSIQISDIHHTFPFLRSLTIDGEFLIEEETHYWESAFGGRTRVADGGSSLDSLKSVSFCVPLRLVEHQSDDKDTGLPYSDLSKGYRDNWGALSSIFKWYKESGAQLKYLDVRGRPREETDSRLRAKELSALFPAAKIHV